MAFSKFEHAVLSDLKALPLQESPCYVAVSGGADSMALLEVLRRLALVLRIELAVIHIHHGASRKVRQNEFRNKSFRLVKRYCNENEVLFVSNLTAVKKVGGRNVYDFKIKPKTTLKSEDDFRKFRHFSFSKLVPKGAFIFFAHHLDDLLETRMIQMMRGTGVKGITSMSLQAEHFIRPLLKCTKSELKAYLKFRKIKFISDPSNSENDPLRNWVRNVWFPQLDKKRKGSLKNISNSLQNLLNAVAEGSGAAQLAINNNEINMKIFNTLTPLEKSQALAFYMNQLGLQSYSQNHIKEILKRLDSPTKNLNFRLLKCTWTKNTHCIKAVAISGSKGSN